MKTYMLHINIQSKTLIVFFAGFASHYSHFQNLISKYNVMMCYDYRDFSSRHSLESLFLQYKKVYLVAYSMGVCIASKLFVNCDVFCKTIALCGTNMGIHKEFGIAPMIFYHTVKHFCLDDFKKVLFGKNQNLANTFLFENEMILKEELQSLYEFCKKDQNQAFLWNKVYLAKQDRLFLPDICLQTFDNDSEICMLNMPHYPFFAFKSWEEICAIE